jgi:threonine dehydrogenase-like Zn-dependent dehydrogenase
MKALASSTRWVRPSASLPVAGEEALVMLSDILPTALECGVLKGRVQPGDTVAIVGSGPIGAWPPY